MSNGRNESLRAVIGKKVLGESRYDSITKALRMPDTLPAIRRYFINTVFDSTCVVLGVIIGTAMVGGGDNRIAILTIITSCLALSISTMFSVYEAENLEKRIKILEIERAMLRKLDKSSIEKTSRLSTLITVLIAALAPWLAATVTLLPLLLVTDLKIASWLAIGATIMVLFVTGLLMGRMGSRDHPALYGVRMAVVGIIVFVLSMLIERLL